jgi:hypothetical protein
MRPRVTVAGSLPDIKEVSSSDLNKINNCPEFQNIVTSAGDLPRSLF